jgi:subtilisin family serine protease
MRCILRITTVGLTGALFAAAIPAGCADAQELQQEFVPGELIVGYRKAQDRERALVSSSLDAGDLQVRGLALPDVQTTPIGDRALKLRLRMPAGLGRTIEESPANELAALRDVAAQIKAKDSGVRYAHPNWVLSLDPPDVARALREPAGGALQQEAAPNDPFFTAGLLWHYQAPPVGMNAVGAWRRSTGSKDVVAAVVDTGLYSDHPDVRGSGNFLPGYNFVTTEEGGRGRGEGAAPTETCSSSNVATAWHGSHVAGVIGAVASNNGLAIAGVNWNVTVLPVRVLGGCGGGTLQDIADGVKWAAGRPVEGAPANSRPAHVINISLGGRGACTQDNVGYLIDALNEARSAGSVVVAAAGNDHIDIKDFYPAGCSGVISVAASDKQGGLARYSNYGEVTVMAPGGDVNKKDEKGRPEGVWSVARLGNKYGVLSSNGTSMAAPHVSAAIALALAVHPEWRGKPDIVEKMVRAAVTPLRPGACSEPCGPGQLDAVKLLDGAGSAGLAASMEAFPAGRRETGEAKSYNAEGDAASLKGEYERAIVSYGKAIRVAPDYANAYNGRAWAYYKSGEAARGLPDAERALELRPNDPHLLDTRGHILEQLGRREEAIADYRRALSHDSGMQAPRAALRRLEGGLERASERRPQQD